MKALPCKITTRRMRNIPRDFKKRQSLCEENYKILKTDIKKQTGWKI